MAEVVARATHVFLTGLEQAHVRLHSVDLLRQQLVRMLLFPYLRRAPSGIQRILVKDEAPKQKEEPRNPVRPGIHQRPLDQRNQRRCAKSQRQQREAPPRQLVAGKHMRRQQFPENPLFHRQQHKEKEDIERGLHRQAVDARTVKRRHDRQDQCTAHRLKQHEPEGLHPRHEKMAHALVPDDDEGKRKKRDPAEIVDVLVCEDVDTRVAEIRDVNRERNRHPEQYIFPEAGPLLHRELVLKRKITEIGADGLNQRKTGRHSHSENHKHPFRLFFIKILCYIILQSTIKMKG